MSSEHYKEIAAILLGVIIIVGEILLVIYYLLPMLIGYVVSSNM